ncbi:MAG: YggT family protein [Chthonomonadales bacterium]|nr:YggT family protein [Chthonomonadales bacterium]
MSLSIGILLAQATQALATLIFIDVVVSWAWMAGIRGASPYQPWVRMLRRITEPILAPIRRLLPAQGMGGLDLSPMLAILLLQVIAGVFARL